MVSETPAIFTLLKRTNSLNLVCIGHFVRRLLQTIGHLRFCNRQWPRFSPIGTAREQRASISGQQFRLFRKPIDEFQNCFLLIEDGSFVIVFNRQKLTYPPQQALKLGTMAPQVQIYWFLYKQVCIIPTFEQ